MPSIQWYKSHLTTFCATRAFLEFKGISERSWYTNVDRNASQNEPIPLLMFSKCCFEHCPYRLCFYVAFFPFVVSFFGSFGSTAVWCLFSLADAADLELRQHDSHWQIARRCTPMLDPSSRSQFRLFRAICYWQKYWQISAYIDQGCRAVAKAAVMCLRGVPRSTAAVCPSSWPCLELPWPGRFLLSSRPSYPGQCNLPQLPSPPSVSASLPLVHYPPRRCPCSSL